MEDTTQDKPDTNVSSKAIEKSEENIQMENEENIKSQEISTEQIEENTIEVNSEHENEHENEKSDNECSLHSGDESDDASVILEREEGDGQESTPNRKVDDDEDKRNPQYIPKRGTFYEHDDRTAVDEEEEEGEKEKERSDKENKKKVWLEKEGNKWSHDRFNDQEQAPKSRAELVAIYGYDIRNEEGPPRARRRRRYGRGPNKYTRNWEDEEAYSKPTNVSAKPVPRKPRRTKDGEEFPPLVGGADEDTDSKSPVPDPKSDGNVSSEPKEPALTELGAGDSKSQQENGAPIARNAHTASKPHRGGRSGSRSDGIKPTPNSNNVRGVTKTRGFFKNGVRNSDTTRARNQKNQKHEDENSDYIMSQNFTNKTHNQSQQQNVQKLEKDMANMSMQQPEFTGSGGNNANRGGKFTGGNSRQTSVPPRLQAEQRGAKRYSSLRQRSLPETAANPQFGQHPQFYQNNEFPAEYAAQPSAAPASVPINGGAHVIQAPFAQPFPPAPPAAFLPPVQPAVPQPYIPQQPPPPQIINYAQPPPQPYPQPTFTNFQHQQFNPVNQAQPAELYQPQGGITYYSTHGQQAMPRVQQKRVKAAIPIVPPPEHKEPRGRGRLVQGEDSPVGCMPEAPPEDSVHHDNPAAATTAAVAPMVVQQ